MVALTTADPTPMSTLLSDPTVRRIRMSELLRQGVVVKLAIRQWRPWASMTAEDLGLPDLTPDEEAQLGDMRRLGKQLLAESKRARRLANLETKAHDTLYRWSIETLGRRFVPVTAYTRWKAENATLMQAFWAAVEAMIDAWDADERLLRGIYGMAGERAYDTLATFKPEVAAVARAAWVTAYVDRILARRPSAEQARARYDFRVELEYLDPGLTQPGPGAETAAGVAGLADLEADLTKSLKAQRQRLADEFVVDCLAKMQGVIAEMADQVVRSVEKNGFVGGSSARQLKAFVDEAPLLNFAGDPEVAAIIAQVRRLADLAPEDRDPADVAITMRAISTLSRRALIDLGRDPRGIISPPSLSRPSDEAIRQARLVLQITTASPVAFEGRAARPVDGLADEPGPGTTVTGAFDPISRGRRIMED